MKKIVIILSGIIIAGSFSSCEKYLDINKDADRIVETQAPIDLLFTNVTVNIGFMGGSDMSRWSSLFTQQYSGQTTGGETQTQMFEKYLIQSADVNGFWSTAYATTLNDIEVVINQAKAKSAPAYGGIAKILKAYMYQIIVDAWGKVPYSETQQTSANTSPKYDDDAQIYTTILALIDEGINDINTAPAGSLAPSTNSTIYTGAFATKKANWIKFANTLKLRMYLHYSKSDPAGCLSKITSLVNTSGVTFFAANADNFEMPFFTLAGRQNPYYQFAINRADYLFANKFMVDLMNTKVDPRRASYFTQFPAASGLYAGAKSADVASKKYSRLHSYLKGTATLGANGPILPEGFYNETGANGFSYTGDAPVRLLTFAEYNFIRAEAAVLGAPGDAQTFYQAGITASMLSAGVAQTAIDAYLLTNGPLTGTNAQKIQKIIEEKYIANYGVVEEPWTDWRRTGYPAIAKVSNAVTTDIIRSLPYPQSEIDANPKLPGQKTDLAAKFVFWDK